MTASLDVVLRRDCVTSCKETVDPTWWLVTLVWWYKTAFSLDQCSGLDLVRRGEWRGKQCVHEHDNTKYKFTYHNCFMKVGMHGCTFHSHGYM